MMDEMIAIATVEKEKKAARRAAERKKEDETFGAGLKAGFLNQAKKKKKKKKPKPEAEAAPQPELESGSPAPAAAPAAGTGVPDGAADKPQVKKKTKKKKKKKQDEGLFFRPGFLNLGGGDRKKINKSKTRSKKKSQRNEVGAGAAGKKASSPASAAAADDDDIIRPLNPNATAADSLRLDSVQEAMRNTMKNQSEWMTPDLMQRMARNPKLMAGMANPRCMRAMEEFQKAPAEASQKYKDDEVVNSFMTEFMGLMGDHMVRVGEKKKRMMEINSPAEAAQAAQTAEVRERLQREDPEVARVLANQEVVEILGDEKMRRVMQECAHPGRLRQYMADPVIGKKLRLLEKHGLVKFQ